MSREAAGALARAGAICRPPNVPQLWAAADARVPFVIPGQAIGAYILNGPYKLFGARTEARRGTKASPIVDKHLVSAS